MYLMDVDGFSVDAVYQHYHPSAERPDHHIVKHDVGAARRRLATFVDQTLPTKHPVRSLQDAPWKPIRNFNFTKTPPSQFSSWANPKEKITAMLRMITQVDPASKPYTTNPEVFTDKVGLFTAGNEASNEASMNSLRTAQYDLYNKLVAGPITAACLLYSKDGGNVSDTPAECNDRRFGAYKEDYGVTAVLYKNANTNQTILFFQGTYGTSYGNMKNAGLNWIIEKSQATVIKQWEQAGNVLSSEQKKRMSTYEGLYDLVIKTVGGMQVSAYLKELGVATSGAGASTQDQQTYHSKTAGTNNVGVCGLWPITKAMVRDMLPVGRDKAGEVTDSPNHLTDSFYISGHSQGGMRASQVSMWLEKVDGVKYDTTTFAGTGPQCSARNGKYMSGCDMTADMDSGVYHSQITQYVDVFDVYGHYDLPTGNICTYGTSNQLTRPARKYFETVVGYPGSVLAGAGQEVSGLNVDTITGLPPSIFTDFSTSRYFTHYMWALANNLIYQPGYLKDDGTTDGGCIKQETVPFNQCPTGNLTAAAKRVLTGLIIGLVVGLLVLVALVCYCCKKCKKGKKDKANAQGPGATGTGTGSSTPVQYGKTESALNTGVEY
jgi:hypothetical protein